MDSKELHSNIKKRKEKKKKPPSNENIKNKMH
jgi:hypothetical protein